MSDLLITSHVLLWIGLLVNVVVLLALMRQVGSLLLRVQSTGTIDAGYGPEVGEDAPWLPGPMDHSQTRLRALVFLSTTCNACDELVPALNTLASSYASSLSVVAIVRESGDDLLTWAPRRRLKVSLLSAPDAFEKYQVDGTPYAFIIDSSAQVAARGGVNHLEHLEGLLRSCSSDSSTHDGQMEPTIH